MIETRTSDAVLARLEALEAQAAEITAQKAEIAVLRGEVANLKTQNARLTAALSAPAVPAPPMPITTSRRGMLRRVLGASAAAAVLLVAREAATAEATFRGTLVAGGASTDTYGILATQGATGDPDGLIDNVTSTNHGVIGASANPFINPPSGSGVLGQGSSFYGVIGLSEFGEGMHGRSTNSVGVHGKSTNTAGVQGEGVTGVYGIGTSTAGVFGASEVGFGVWGSSNAGAAVYGTSNAANGSGFGVRGEGPNAGVYGRSAQYGVWGVANGAGAYAGVFTGPVFINGSYTALGAKSAAVKKRDGTHARMYCQEAPEPWFEDFGTAELKGGQASVPLDPEFDEVVKGDDYRVFLTAIGDTGFLYVSRKGPHRFEVRSERGAAANGSFDFRVVARRLDPVGGRMERVNVPDLSAAARNVKPAPEPPKPPAPPTGRDRREP